MSTNLQSLNKTGLFYFYYYIAYIQKMPLAINALFSNRFF